MDLSPKPNRVLCAEPLEGRWLLSGAAPADPPGPSATSNITLEFEEVTEEEEEEDVVIPLSQVPANVLAAFQAAYRGVTIDEVELEEDEERGAEYGISATTHEGTEIDITVSPQGQIVERETSIDVADVPQAVIDKVLEQYPGAEITAAADLGGGNYEVEFIAADGVEWEGETTPAPPTAPPAEETPEEPGLATAQLPAPVASASDAPDIPADVDATPAQHQQAVARAERTTTAAGAESDEAIEEARAAAATTVPGVLDPRVTQALEALAAGVGANVWLPQVADAVVDVLPVDVAAVERGLQEMLDKLGQLSGQASEESPLTIGASRLAMAVVLVAVVKLLTHSSRKPTAGPVVLFGGVNSSWSWVLGTTTPKRRRITLSRQRDP